MPQTRTPKNQLDASLVDTTASQTLTNKTLAAPRVDQINDTNGNAAVVMTPVASAVNQLTVANAASTGHPSIAATGTTTNLDVVVAAKGNGALRATSGGGVVITGNTTTTSPASTDGKIYMQGTSNVRPMFVNGSATPEAIITNGHTSYTAWQDWSPTITGFSAVPSGGIYRYIQIGKTVHVILFNPFYL